MRMHTFVIALAMVVCCGCGSKTEPSPSGQSKTPDKKSTKTIKAVAPTGTQQFVITVEWPGASPQEVELQIAAKIEHAIKVVPHIESVKSVIKDSLCIVTVAFDSKAENDETLMKLRTAIDTIPDSPPELMKLVVGMRVPNPDPVRIIWTPHLSDSAPAGQIIRQADELRKQFQKLSDVADVDVSGVPDHQVVVQLDPAKLRQFSLTFRDVHLAIERSSGLLPGQPRYDGTKKSIERLQKLPVASRNQRAILLRDVADVQSVSFTQQAARFNGKSAIVFHVTPRDSEPIGPFREEILKKISGRKRTMKLQGDTVFFGEPAADITIVFPDGTPSDNRRKVESQVMSILKKQTVSALLVPGRDDEWDSTILLSRFEKSPARRDMLRAVREALQTIPGATFHVTDRQSERLHVRLLGPDLELLRKWGEASRQSLQAITGVAGVRANGLSSKQEIQVKLRSSARELGITHRDLLDAGLAPVTIGQNVLLKHSGDSRNLQGRMIRTMNGMLIDLATVATMTVTTSPKQLLRHNGTRMVELEIITGAKTTSNELKKQLRQAIEKSRPKAGDGKDYRLEIGVNRR